MQQLRDKLFATEHAVKIEAQLKVRTSLLVKCTVEKLFWQCCLLK